MIPTSDAVGKKINLSCTITEGYRPIQIQSVTSIGNNAGFKFTTRFRFHPDGTIDFQAGGTGEVDCPFSVGWFAQ